MTNTKSEFEETDYKRKYQILKWRIRALAFMSRRLEYPADAWKVIGESIKLINIWERKEE